VELSNLKLGQLRT